MDYRCPHCYAEVWSAQYQEHVMLDCRERREDVFGSGKHWKREV